MNCNHCKPQLATSLYEDLPPEERLALEAHLKECVSCRDLEKEWRRSLAHVAKPVLPQEAAFWMRQKASIMARLPERSSQPAWGRWSVASFAAVASVSLWVWHQQVQKTDLRIAQHVELLKNMEMIDHLDMLQDLDVLENTSHL